MRNKSKITSIASAFVIGILLVGCNGRVPGSPKTSFSIERDIEQLEKAFRPADAIKEFYAGRQTVQRRNQLVLARITIINLRYLQFIRGLTRNKALIDSALDIVVIGIDLAVATIGGKAIKAALGAASAGLSASRLSVDKNVFYEQTVPAIVTAMNARRREIFAEILEGISKPLSEYSFFEAITDLYQYQYAGTFPGAIEAIKRESSLRKEKADLKVRKVKVISLDRNSRADTSLSLTRRKTALIRALPRVKKDTIIRIARNPPVKIKDGSVQPLVNRFFPNITTAAQARSALHFYIKGADEEEVSQWESLISSIIGRPIAGSSASKGKAKKRHAALSANRAIVVSTITSINMMKTEDLIKLANKVATLVGSKDKKELTSKKERGALLKLLNNIVLKNVGDSARLRKIEQQVKAFQSQ